MDRCGRQHRITHAKCTLKLGHVGDHAAPCRVKHCGAYGTMHSWPR